MAQDSGDNDKRTVTRGDVRIVWVIVSACVVVLGAYFKLENSYSDLSRRITVIETKQNSQDTILRGIEKSVSRIEGRLGVGSPPAGTGK